MSPNGDLGSVDRKIEWADQQIHDLEARFPAFRESGAYRVVREPHDEAKRTDALVLRVNEPAADAVLTEISLRVGDIAHNLRSALDHLAYRIAAGRMADHKI